VDAVAEQLHQLEAEVKANLATPRTDTVAFLNQSLARLRSIPFDVEPRTRIDCLLSIVQQFHHQGQSVFSAVEPAALAVMLAEQLGDKTLLRRALNLQGIVLFSTSNPGDAIRSLARALEIAQSLGDEELQAGTWNNLAAAFYEAALYSDSRECLLQAADLALGVPKLRGLRGLALSNVALCCLHTRDYQEGIERIKDSISLMPPPTSPAEMLVRVQAEANFTRLLLATGRVREASERVQLAKEFAAQAKSVRADIAAACAEGLVEVYSGLTDVGLSRGMAALEKARVIKPTLRETLLALVQAHEKAGRPDRALALHRELTLHVRKAQQDNIVTRDARRRRLLAPKTNPGSHNERTGGARLSAGRCRCSTSALATSSFSVAGGGISSTKRATNAASSEWPWFLRRPIAVRHPCSILCRVSAS